MRKLRRLLFAVAFLPVLSWAQNNVESGRKISGDASLLSNYIWHGLTQTKLNPAIQSSIFYNLNPVLRFGAWGSNVTYYNGSKANALLKLKGDINVQISPNTAFGIHFSDNHYFETDDRDGNTLGIDFEAYRYNFLIEQEGNWQKAGNKARYLKVERTWDVFTNWKWENHIGYTMFQGGSYSDYLDFLSGIGMVNGAFSWQVGATTTSKNTQFDNYADIFFYLALKVSF